MPLPSAVIIPTVQNSGIDEEGELGDNDRVNNNAEKLCKYMNRVLLYNLHERHF